MTVQVNANWIKGMNQKVSFPLDDRVFSVYGSRVTHNIPTFYSRNPFSFRSNIFYTYYINPLDGSVLYLIWRPAMQKIRMIEYCDFYRRRFDVKQFFE